MNNIPGYKSVLSLSEPITSMCEFKGHIFVASGCCVYQKKPEDEKFNQVKFLVVESEAA